jgi:hypothetical protein
MFVPGESNITLLAWDANEGHVVGEFLDMIIKTSRMKGWMVAFCKRTLFCGHL